MRYLLMALPALALAAQAQAQETAVGGFRVEALVGYDQFSDSDEEEAPVSARPSQPTGNVKGGFYGGGVGYDIGMGGVLLGVDAEYTDTTADRRIFGLTGTGAGTVTTFGNVKFGRDLYVGGRATFAASPTFNVYVKAGYTNLRVSLDPAEDQFADELDALDLDLDANLDGVRGGLGLQYAPEGRAYYGLELRYSNYQDDLERKQVALTVGYRF